MAFQILTIRETAQINLGLLLRLGSGMDEAHVERGFSPFARDLQHVVHCRIDALFFQSFRPFRQSSDERFQFGAGGGRYYAPACRFPERVEGD